MVESKGKNFRNDGPVIAGGFRTRIKKGVGVQKAGRDEGFPDPCILFGLNIGLRRRPQVRFNALMAFGEFRCDILILNRT